MNSTATHFGTAARCSNMRPQAWTTPSRTGLAFTSRRTKSCLHLGMTQRALGDVARRTAEMQSSQKACWHGSTRGCTAARTHGARDLRAQCL